MVPIQILRAALLGVACVIVLPGCAAEDGRRSTGQYTDDVAVTARVREALIRAPGLRSNTIQVETYRGTVQLSGFADDEDSAANAIAAARQVPGVNEVRNNIQVRKPQ